MGPICGWYLYPYFIMPISLKCSTHYGEIHFSISKAFCVLTKKIWHLFQDSAAHFAYPAVFTRGSTKKKRTTNKHVGYWICLKADDKSNRSLYFKHAGTHVLANPHTSAVCEHLNCGHICACQRLGNMKLCGFGVLFL